MNLNQIQQTIEGSFLVIRIPLNGEAKKTPEQTKHLRGTTIAFLDDLKKTFGNGVISRKDKRLSTLLWRHHISSFPAMLKSLEDKGIAVVERNLAAGPSNRIVSFIINA